VGARGPRTALRRGFDLRQLEDDDVASRSLGEGGRMRACHDPHRKAVLSNLQQMWMVLADERRFLTPQELAASSRPSAACTRDWTVPTSRPRGVRNFGSTDATSWSASRGLRADAAWGTARFCS
jgi:hypothetical protein